MVTIEAAEKDVALFQWLKWLYWAAENTAQLALGLGSQSQTVP